MEALIPSSKFIVDTRNTVNHAASAVLVELADRSGLTKGWLWAMATTRTFYHLLCYRDQSREAGARVAVPRQLGRQHRQRPQRCTGRGSAPATRERTRDADPGPFQ